MRTNAIATLQLKSNGALLHRQLSVMLRQQIMSGRYRHGEQLPTQEELCRQFSVSRITVRRALADLQTEGLIRNEQGVGTFVTAEPIAPQRSHALGFVGELDRAYEETTMQLLSLRLARCPLQIAMDLGLSDMAEALHVVRTRSRADAPVMLLDAWMPPEFAGAVTASALQEKPLYQLLAGGPDRLGKVIQEINASLADPVVAAALNIDVNAPTLKIERLMHNLDGDPIQHLTIWSTPLRSRLVMEVEAEELNTLNTGRLLHDVKR